MDDSSATMTPQRTSPRQQETRHRMLEYLTTSMTPLLQAANDESEDGVLTSDAFPSFEPTSAAEDPKEPSERTTSELEDAKSPRDPSLGHKSFKASTSMTTVTPMKGFDLFSLSMNEIFALFTTLPDAFFPRKRLYLPKLTKTLVLDLDETLIHSNSSLSTGNNSSSSAESTIFNSISQWFNPPAPAYDMMIEVLLNKHSCLYYIRKRPFCDYFLKIVSQWYNLVIFTASLPEYAEPVIDWLDNGARILQKRFYRQTCTIKDGLYLKDLSFLEPDLGRVLLIDNSPMSFLVHPDNCIPIKTWISDGKDEALLDLLPFLDALRFTEDVRSILSMRKR